MPTDNSEHPLLSAFKRMHKQLMATAQKILTSSDDAEDALQDAFVKLWTSTSIFKSEQDASAMLHVATKRISLNAVRNRISIPMPRQRKLQHPRQKKYIQSRKLSLSWRG